MGTFMHHRNIRCKDKYSQGGFADSRHQEHNAIMNIAAIRKARGLTQTDLADMTKLAQPTISRAENGDDGTTLQVFRSIAAALNVALADLFVEGRSAAEQAILETFRQLPPDRQQGWLDLARVVLEDR